MTPVFLSWTESFDGVDNPSRSPSLVTTVILKILCKFNVVKSERQKKVPRTFYRSSSCMVLILETRLSLIWRMWIWTGHFHVAEISNTSWSACPQYNVMRCRTRDHFVFRGRSNSSTFNSHHVTRDYSTIDIQESMDMSANYLYWVPEL